ncbi:MAG TPA: hypothetical protein VFR94_11590 [Nitrososphaeraceae archaeon]|nr:hypothetical protein [Nitrososphaeraceae archaeon]
MTIDFAELENDAKRFFELKHSEKTASELNNIAIKIIDEISLPEFSFPIHNQSVVSNRVTTFVYRDNLTYPNLLEFIAEVLHTKIPVIINTARFGPGEIIVNKENEQEALDELNSCIKELQLLIHAKKVKYS